MLDLLFRRKYVILFSFTGVLLFTMYLSPKLILSTVQTAAVVKAEDSVKRTTVTGSGSIVAPKQREIYYSNALKVKDIYVKVGDSVKAGQTLMSVDREDTIETLETVNQTADATEETANVYSALAASYSTYLDSYLSTYASAYASAASESSQSDYTKKIPDAITAPISGIITAINAQTGSFTSASVPVAVVTDLSNIQMKAKISEVSIAGVKTGQKVTITGDGFDGSYTGTVVQIYPTAEKVTTTSGVMSVVTTLIKINQPGKDLKPGLTANAEIVTSESTTVSVPYEAVQEDNQNREYVFAVRKHRAYRCFVKTGEEYKNSVEIVSGVQPGDMVVINPSSDLKSGQYVREIIKSEDSEDD